MNNDDFYIQVLKFAASKAPDGFTQVDYENWAKDTYGTVSDDTRLTLKHIRQECFHSSTRNHKPIFSLKSEYYYRLVEFQELEESRKASSEANKNSQVAIGFSILAIATSLIIGAIQLNSRITIDYDQVNRMETKKFPITQKIESRQLNQVIDALEQSNINTAELARLIREQNEQTKTEEVKKW